ncbi:MAG: Bro-N domain-containing protein [Cloacibacillus sp.]
MSNKIALFENKKIRSVWVEAEEEWYFSVVDVVEALTDSADPKQYIKKMRSRDSELNGNWGTICTPVEMIAADGKRRKVQAADTRGILRLIQSIPSPKAEPFKLWLARVGAERIEETADPELAIDRAFETYLKKGYTKEWIHQRLLSIRIRNDLTAEWDTRGVTRGMEYAILTDEITKAWTGMTTRQYKSLKGLKKENLRDNMSDLELVLNMLAEATTTEISKTVKPETFDENATVARQGGQVAGNARKEIEAKSGRPVITKQNAIDFTNLIELIAEIDQEKKDNAS